MFGFGFDRMLDKSGDSYYKSLCSFYLDGINKYLSRADVANLDAFLSGPTPLFTIRTIFKRNSLGTTQGLFSKRVSGARQIMFRLETSNKLRLFFSGDGSVEWVIETTNALTSTTNWYDISVTFDYTQTGINIANVFINGVKETMVYISGTYTTNLFDSNNPSLWGQQGGNTFFLNAYINQVSIMNYVPADILFLAAYNSGLPIISTEIFNATNVRLEWIFDNDVWDGVKFTLTDSSGVGNDGQTINILPVDKDCNENPY